MVHKVLVGLSGIIITSSLLLSACTSDITTGAVSVPFEMQRNVPLVKTSVRGTNNLYFLVDTGTDPSVVDEAVARRTGLPIDDSQIGEAEGAGDGPGLAIMGATIEGLEIQGVEYPEIISLAADLSSFSKALDLELAGILGDSFLNDQIIRINYDDQTFSFAQSIDQFPPIDMDGKQEHVIPLRTNSDDDPIPVFEITVDGAPVNISLDTGKSAGIEFYQPISDRLDLTSKISDMEDVTRLGARGRRTLVKGKLSGVSLGPFQLAEVPVSLSNTVPGSEERRDGNAGNAFLSHFIVTIDYKNEMVYFVR